MRRFSEYLLSEKVTAAITALVVIGVVFGLVVGNQRTARVERALASIDEAQKQLSAKTDTGSTSEEQEDLPRRVVCDKSLLAPNVLANDYITLTLQPTPLHPLDLSKGYGPGIYFRSNQKEDGDDAYVSINKLYKALKKDRKEALRGIEIEKEERFIQYSILLSEDLVCDETGA